MSGDCQLGCEVKPAIGIYSCPAGRYLTPVYSHLLSPRPPPSAIITSFARKDVRDFTDRTIDNGNHRGTQSSKLSFPQLEVVSPRLLRHIYAFYISTSLPSTSSFVSSTRTTPLLRPSFSHTWVHSLQPPSHLTTPISSPFTSSRIPIGPSSTPAHQPP